MNQEKTNVQTHCRRCGTCCMKGGPALHRDDAGLFSKGLLDTSCLYTLRKGETVRNLDEKLMILDEEIVKIKGGKDIWTCMYYDDIRKECTIYADRPLECRMLKCWDLIDFYDAMATPYLRRQDLLAGNEGLLKIITAHDQRCSYDALRAAVEETSSLYPKRGIEKILDLLHYDDFMRPFLMERLGLAPDSMDFLFGRPLATTIGMFGLKVTTEGHHRVLVPINPSKNR